MASEIGKLIEKVKSGKELRLTDFIRLSSKTSAGEREELVSFLGDVAEGRFTKEHVSDFANKYPILGKDESIIDSICDVIDQITDGGYGDMINTHILNK